MTRKQGNEPAATDDEQGVDVVANPVYRVDNFVEHKNNPVRMRRETRMSHRPPLRGS